MTYLGDLRVGVTFDCKFCTVNTSGAPTTLAGSPVISAYPDNSTTQLTAGITLSVDFDSVTGMHNVRVVATGGNGYVTATNYALVITTGTVGGTSVVGYVVAHFSLEARSALMPTTAARTLDVTATGGAGVDWSNVEAPTTTLALTGTTIATTQKVDVETIKTQAVTAAAGVTFPTSIASPTNITAGTITTVTNLTNAPTAGDLTATMKTSVTTAATAATPTAAAVTGSVGSVVGLTASNLDTTISSRASAANLAIVAAFIDTEIADIKAKTDLIPASPAAVGSAMTLTSGERNSVADALLDRADAVEVGLTPRQSMRLNTAAAAGKLSGAATTTATIRNAVADSKNRIVATVDSDGNRTAVTTDVT